MYAVAAAPSNLRSRCNSPIFLGSNHEAVCCRSARRACSLARQMWYPRSSSMLEHRLAKLAAAATFLLLVIGGTVNPTGSSLACPEPTLVCHGQLFPPMVGGVFYEHGHRLAAMTVGLLQIALTVMLARRRSGHRRLA